MYFNVYCQALPSHFILSISNENAYLPSKGSKGLPLYIYVYAECLRY